ncbi:uncharacterized protein CCR75_006090 [Bremia lactucae]|uniref:Uncharacterized protein n=1 Tax=Bremia lactucae TaxID=4779 RepID=A0A976FGY0_BRELC|nr:hypothetical protein CCR75_006090 [Bremia lactucae]
MPCNWSIVFVVSSLAVELRRGFVLDTSSPFVAKFILNQVSGLTLSILSVVYGAARCETGSGGLPYAENASRLYLSRRNWNNDNVSKTETVLHVRRHLDARL